MENEHTANYWALSESLRTFLMSDAKTIYLYVFIKVLFMSEVVKLIE